MAIHFNVQDTQFTTEEVYHVEEATTSYFTDLITQDESLRFLDDPKNVLSISVDVKRQMVEGEEVVLSGGVTMMHYGDQGIIDLAALLTFLVNKNNTDSDYVYMDQLLADSIGATVEYLDFDFVSESVPLAANLTTLEAVEEGNNEGSDRSGSEKALIVVVTLLSITLLGLSVILCWIGGGWLQLRQKVKELLLREEEMTRMTNQPPEIKPKNTEETADDCENSPTNESKTNFTNPSGILGVYGMNNYGVEKLQGLGIKTPARSKNGEIDEEMATPMSVYSDSDRAPIGIMSMRKLVGSNAIMQSNEDNSDNEQDQDENCLPDPSNIDLGMKKLEY